MSKKWVKQEVDLIKTKKLQEETELSQLTCELLVSRGIETKKHADLFLKPNFKEDLHNPSSLADIDKTLKRINKAITGKEKILIHGDYDADGVTTTTIFVKGFKLLGVEVDFFVPNRFKDGYGVNVNNVEKFAAYDLVITGDTGIRAFESIQKLTNEYNTDVIVTDHHEPLVVSHEDKALIPENAITSEINGLLMALPDCYAVVNPHRLDCNYPGKDLSGAGVAFKVMEALFEYLHYGKRDLYQMLDLVAAGLVPDLVHMFNIKHNSFEVRNLVKLGLAIMNKNPKPWVRSIQEIKEEKKNKKPSKYETKKVYTATDLGFSYGPILNAAGRLYDPTPAAEYLMEDNEMKSKELAAGLIGINEERQRLSADNTTQILKDLKDAPTEFLDYGIVVASKNLHVGITGLIAGKVLEEYYRTTVALAEVEKPDGSKVYKGSARSIPGISVLDALIDVEKEIGSYVYGGHPQAGGLTLEASQVEPFRKAFRLAVKKQVDLLGDETVFQPKTIYDAEIKFSDMNYELLDELNSLEPYGMGNSEPIFFSKDVLIEKVSFLGKEGKYLKFQLIQNGIPLEAVMFSKAKDTMEAYDNALDRYFHVPCEFLGYPQINDFNGKIQLILKDIKVEPNLHKK